jgi:hypothetical protein
LILSGHRMFYLTEFQRIFADIETRVERSRYAESMSGGRER